MTTVAELRRQHPGAYDDLTDEQIAQRLHDRYYSDIPYEQFAQRVGVRPAQVARPAPDQPQNEQERTALQREHFRRGVLAGIGLFGSMGAAIQPLADAVTDPLERQAAGRQVREAFSGGVDLPRLAGDTMAAGQRAVEGFTRDPMGAIGNVIAHIPQMAAGMTYQPIVDQNAARDRQVLAQMRGDRPGAEQAASDAVTAARHDLTNIVGGVAGPGVRTAVGGAALGAALTAPNSLLDAHGTLQERLPQTLVDTAGASIVGGALPVIGNSITGALNLPTRAQQLAQRLRRAGVDPSLAALNADTFGGRMTGAMTNAIADNPVAGVAVRPRIGRQMEQAATESQRIQGGYGTAMTPEGAGQVVQRGLRRYAGSRTEPNPNPGADPRTIDTSEWSVPAQADAVFDHVLRPVENNSTGVQQTMQALQAIDDLAHNDPSVMAFRNDPVIRDLTTAVHDAYTRPNQPLTLRAARELRRRLRNQMDAPQLAGGQDNASLQRVYHALSEDIYAAAGPAGDALRKADQFYARHMTRIRERLASVVDPAHPDRIAPSQAFQAIVRAADGQRGNTRMLVSLKNALRPEEMRTLAASIIDHMGQPTAGAGGTQAAELGFSVNTFSTNFRRMSPLARRVLFGSSNSQLASALDNLAAVADALKGVERTTNASGSGRYANIAATAGGVVANLPATMGALTIAGVTGEMLTNPAFVRWLASASSQPASAGGARQMLAALARIASRDPAVLPVYNRLARAQRSPEPDQLELSQ